MWLAVQGYCRIEARLMEACVSPVPPRPGPRVAGKSRREVASGNCNTIELNVCVCFCVCLCVFG